MNSETLMEIREAEQRAAADMLGVKTIQYLDKLDGYVSYDLDTRKTVVGIIRKLKPGIVVTCDPANVFTRDGHINHPDHRSVGQQVVDAVFPAVGNRFFFPELLKDDLIPHKISELWLSIPNDANTIIDVSETWDLKIQALTKHVSQIGDEGEFRKRMAHRASLNTLNGRSVFEEKFRRIKFR
jgi:LmbE family N-acetylglucosaminyl deacetylase